MYMRIVLILFLESAIQEGMSEICSWAQRNSWGVEQSDVVCVL